MDGYREHPSEFDAAAAETPPADDVVQLSGGDARNHMRHQGVEYFRGQTACAPHPLEPFRPVELDHMAARLGPVFGADLDIFRHPD